MAQKRKTDQSKLLAQAALEVAGKTGFNRLSMAAAAKKAKVSLKTAEAIFPDKWAVLKWLLKDVEAETARKVKPLLGESWRDNLFEVMMTRIGLAAPYKRALSTLPEAFRDEPKQVLKFARLFWRTMANILKTAKAPGGICKPAYVAAFGVLYVSVVDAFLKDDTKDHAKTMAALDQRLGFFEQFVEMASCKTFTSTPAKAGVH